MTLSSLILFSIAHFVGPCSPLPAKPAGAGGSDAAWIGSGPDVLSSASSSSLKSDIAHQVELQPGDSAVPVGAIISSCTQAGTVAVTFDDGPYIYTSELLDTLRDNDIKATFFVNGQNWGSISDEANKATVRRIIDDGHLLGSHTWSHKDLATLDRAGIESELKQLEDALIDIVGKYPTYFRPPYFSTNDLVLQTAGDLGYHVINADIDTLDWQNLDNIQVSVQNFKDGLNAGGSISLEHDVHQATVETLVPAIIEEIRSRGLRAVTVGECLGDPAENWYRTR